MEQENNNLEINPLKFSTKNIVILVFFAVGLYLLASKLVGVEQGIRLLDNINKNFISHGF